MFVEALKKAWKAVALSPLTDGKTKSKKIAYLGLATAFSVIANTFFELKLGAVQYSFTIAVCALLGVLMGAGYGFIVCFIGDGIGFALHPFGAYMPWVGLSNGMIAFLAGLLLNGEKMKYVGIRYAMSVVFCLSSFVLCTVGITNTAFFILYSKGVDYWTYFVSRFFVQGQIWSCLLNYAIVFAFPAFLKKLPFWLD
jgi:ECF transporter S component (folate family)